ncbi:flagellar export protein FliJ [uncultured Photobacterium sp.]|uniref:flagellar export protein FliJ n=1 Tax=uncultured Photobacterium sp. TaxID=173973 RepID=UPI0026047EF4|nr:flagellar FliJ family protein [uncultured Photobacterium sp.]
MLKRVKVVESWRDQQQKKFDELQQHYTELNHQTQAHQQRLELLESLSGQYSVESGSEASALLLKGIGRFRHQLDNLTNLQRQELALSEVELRSMNARLVEQHCQVKMGDKIIDKRMAQIQLKQDRQEQKVLDELSMNRFFHRR